MATREREGLGLVMMISWKDEVTARGCNEARKRSERQNAQPPRLHSGPALLRRAGPPAVGEHPSVALGTDRKSSRLNSSHGYISYAVFCLKKKKMNKHTHRAHTE